MRLKMWIAAAIVLAATAATTATAHAQIVNVQGSLAGEPPAGWSGQVTGSLDWQTGNTSLIRVGGAGNLLYRHGCWLGLALVRGEYSEGEGTLLSKKTFEHLRARYT